MLGGLEPNIRIALMSILATLYESGLVEEVDLADVMRLFGVAVTPENSTRFSFNDEQWIEAYLDFRESNTLILHADDLEDEVEEALADADLSPERKLH